MVAARCESEWDTKGQHKHAQYGMLLGRECVDVEHALSLVHEAAAINKLHLAILKK